MTIEYVFHEEMPWLNHVMETMVEKYSAVGITWKTIC